MVQKSVLKFFEKGTSQRKVKPVWNNTMRINHQNFSNSRRKFAPTAVLTKSGIVPISTARQSSLRAAAPVSAARPINTVAPKPLGNRVTSVVGKQGINDVKSSACWVWRPKIKEHDEGYVVFGGGAKRGMITGKGTIRTGKLNFEDVYFVKELQFNLFSVSQMCDKKNSVLFTDTECVVLSPNFKLADESHVLLKVPRKNNMYNFHMKNIVPQKDLTCLLAKATNDESMLWHKRLGQINFKNINKLVKENLVKDLFGPTSVSSIMHKKYCLVITDDFRRFTWQNRVTERRNRTLIEAARTMLADSKLPTTFWAEAVNTVCYVQNRVLVVKPHFKNPYELFRGRSPALSLMRPFGCHVTILNTLNQLGKFNGKSNEWIFVGYSTISKAFRVYNTITEENMHITFLENKPMITGGRPEWLFDIDALSESMNYTPVPAGTNSNDFAGKGASFDAGQYRLETGPSQDYILMPLWKESSLFDSSSQDSNGHNKDKHGPSQESKCNNQERPNAESSTKNVNTHGPSINTANANDNTGSLNINIVNPPVNTATPTYVDYPSDPLMPDLEDTRIFDDAYDDKDEGAEADYNNLETIISVSPIPSTRIHKDHPKEQIISEFWNIANSKTINSVKQIHAIVDGKAVVISESSVRSDLLFDDEDGITCLTNDEIFENLALMGYEPISTKLTFQKGSFSPQ
nr:hypothetical protein [Tanacetum cinerariifolium]